MIFITGASSGIGAACAKAYARKGLCLVLWARREDRLAELARELRDLGSPEVEVRRIDVRDRASVEAEIGGHPELYSRVEVLVNNAGLARGLGTFQDSKPEHWDEVFGTNVMGLLAVTHAMLPHFLKKNSGHIVNMGSVAARWVYPKGHIYCASKAAVRAMNEALRLDLNGSAIRVTEIVPGMVETEFSEVRFNDPERAKAVYQGMEPLNAGDIAETVVWCTDRPRHVNIQEVVIYPVAQASPTVITRA